MIPIQTYELARELYVGSDDDVLSDLIFMSALLGEEESDDSDSD